MTDTGLFLFTYGTLQIPAVMQAVTGKQFPAIDAALDGCCRYAVMDQVYPAIIDQTGASVSGRLYSGLDPATLKLLDDFENDIYESVCVYSPGPVPAFALRVAGGPGVFQATSSAKVS